MVGCRMETSGEALVKVKLEILNKYEIQITKIKSDYSW